MMRPSRRLRHPWIPARLPRLIEVAPPSEHDLLSSRGWRAYPLLRTHNLLNNLHSVMGSTPLVLFYPGRYDGQTLRLFGMLEDNPYYRAFRLVD